MERGEHSWRGKHLTVYVLFSAAGVAQQVWIESDMGALLVDVGDGTLRDLLADNRHLQELVGIVITHGHFDHVGGLHSLLGYMRMIGRQEPLSIIAPSGCAELVGIVENFRRCYFDSMPFEISFRNLDDKDSWEVGPFSVEARRVMHCGSTAGSKVMAPAPANGYRISFGGEAVAVTGDTGTEADLEGLVKGADLAVIEATFGEADQHSPEELRRVHLSEEEAHKLGRLAKQYLLVHRIRKRP